MKSWLKLGFLITKKISKKKERYSVCCHLSSYTSSAFDVIKRNLNWLYADNEVNILFSFGPMASFRGAWKLIIYPVTVKVYPPELLD